MGLFIKGLSAWVQSRLDPCPEEQELEQQQAVVFLHKTR